MARLINTTAMTVDGVIDVTDWYVAEGGHDAASLGLWGEGTAMLLGRKTFEGLAAFWPTQTGPWADTLNALPKYVGSRSLRGPLPWNATALEGDAVEAVRRLKDERGGDLVMTGCGELARELIEAGLVDELDFWVHPRVQGAGTRPYQAATIPVRLIEARPFDSGVVLLRYQPTSAADR
jgi:dihydrofolate reductase